MSQKHCQGCGAQIQSTQPGQFGFVPEHLLEQQPILCQRCFRINHYGRDEVGPVLAHDSLASIRAGLTWATGVVLVVDLIDFESGLPTELLKLVKSKKTILAANKMDLIPDKTPPREVERWIQERLKHYGLPQVQTALISAVSGYGFPTLADMIRGLGNKIMFVGVTNVGKSSVLQRLLQMRIGGGQKNKIKPTISPYPGTTVSVSRWHCPGDLVLADSPGYVPQGRISDLVSAERSVEIIPHRSLSSHLYPVKVGDLVFISGLCGIECLESSTAGGILLGFTGSGVKWQKSTIKHLDKWLGNEAVQDQTSVELNPGEDLVVSGLGWVSARKARFKLRVHIPQGVKLTIRPNLIGFKKIK